MSLSARMVASTSSATRLTNASGASCANAGGAKNIRGAASINSHLRIILALVIGVSSLREPKPQRHKGRRRVPLASSGASLFHLRRRLSLVELVTSCAKIRIAQEPVLVQRRRLEHALGLEQLRSRVEVAQTPQRPAHPRLIDGADRARVDAHDPPRAVAYAGWAEQGTE